MIICLYTESMNYKISLARYSRNMGQLKFFQPTFFNYVSGGENQLVKWKIPSSRMGLGGGSNNL